MKGEDSFHALIANDSADSESFVNAPPSACDYRACEYLDSLFVSFLDAAADIYGVAYLEVGNIFLQTFAFNSIKHLCFWFIRSFYFLCHVTNLYCGNINFVSREGLRHLEEARHKQAQDKL